MRIVDVQRESMRIVDVQRENGDHSGRVSLLLLPSPYPRPLLLRRSVRPASGMGALLPIRGAEACVNPSLLLRCIACASIVRFPAVVHGLETRDKSGGRARSATKDTPVE
jgi:hypothetical protein